MVGLKCGFDQDFFQALKIKLQHKAESEKHGILIFDEIQVRKSKVVNSRTMTYTGMVNDGEDTQKSSELEDHGLVHSQSAFLHHATPPGELPLPSWSYKPSYCLSCSVPFHDLLALYNL